MKHMLSKRTRNLSIFISTTLNHQDSVWNWHLPPSQWHGMGGGVSGENLPLHSGTWGGGGLRHLRWSCLSQKFVQSFRFQPDKGNVWIVTSNSVMGRAPPDNKSCILLGRLSVDFFSGVAWLTGSSSMVGRPSEDQPCELNRKWK